MRNKLDKTSIPVPCGKCPVCVKRRVSAWSFRLMEEDKKATSSHFVTLTYDPMKIPITRNGFTSLCKSDVQKFLKRLRKSEVGNSKSEIKYYLVGEYGGKTHRPHYHALLFNVSKLSHIEKCWQQGAIHYGSVSGASVGYTLKYMSKRKMIPMHRNDDRLQEFALMSKGLGLSYVNEKTIAFHNADLFNRMCLTLQGGKKASMPRYYKEKIYPESSRKLAANFMKYDNEKREQQARQKYKGDYDRDLIQSHLHQFKQQEKNAKKTDKL